MLRRAIEESQRTAIPKSPVVVRSVSPEPERAPQSPPETPDKSGKEEDSPVDESDKEALRKRRLLKFSGQKMD